MIYRGYRLPHRHMTNITEWPQILNASPVLLLRIIALLHLYHSTSFYLNFLSVAKFFLQIAGMFCQELETLLNPAEPICCPF
jgi:hypothetical protein